MDSKLFEQTHFTQLANNNIAFFKNKQIRFVSIISKLQSVNTYGWMIIKYELRKLVFLNLKRCWFCWLYYDKDIKIITYSARVIKRGLNLSNVFELSFCLNSTQIRIYLHNNHTHFIIISGN